MLEITIRGGEQYDELKNEFYVVKPQVLQVEHSLVSLSKWEAFWCKPFLTKDPKTYTETIDYIRCMTITQNVGLYTYSFIDAEVIKEINDYIDKPMTATKFTKTDHPPTRQVITAEIIYYWMIAFNIPFECQKWHLNRLLALINVCNIMNKPPKKMGKSDIYKSNKYLNDLRRQSLGTPG